MFIATRSGLMAIKTTSGWVEQTGSGTNNWCCIASSADATKLAACVYGGFIYTSADSGATWTERSETGAQSWTDIKISPDGSKIIACAYNSYVFLSINSGEDFTQSTGVVRTWTGITLPESYYSTFFGAADYIYLSTNSAYSFTAKPGTSGGHLSAISSADATKIIIGAAGSGVHISIDSGSTFNYVNPVDSEYVNYLLADCLCASQTGQKVAACAGNSIICTSSNYGISWSKKLNSGVRQWSGIACSSDGSKLVACVYGGYIYRSVDYGTTWDAMTDSGQRNWNGVASSSDGAKLAACVFNGSIWTYSE